MTCTLREGDHEADYDVVSAFDKRTGEFKIFTNDAYVYKGEDLHMRVSCKSDLTSSTVEEDITVKIRQPMRKSIRENSKGERRHLAR